MEPNTKIEPGKFRHRITFYSLAKTQDAVGQTDDAGTAVMTCWAKIETHSGSMSLGAQQFLTTSTHIITIRNPRSIALSASMYIMWNSRRFIIQAILNPDETNKLLRLTCVEKNEGI